MERLSFNRRKQVLLKAAIGVGVVVILRQLHPPCLRITLIYHPIYKLCIVSLCPLLSFGVYRSPLSYLILAGLMCEAAKRTISGSKGNGR